MIKEKKMTPNSSEMPWCCFTFLPPAEATCEKVAAKNQLEFACQISQSKKEFTTPSA